jgi:D-alanyl-D-alanine carboxypeptidase
VRDRTIVFLAHFIRLQDCFMSRLFRIAAFAATLPFATSHAQTPSLISKEVAAAKVDSMVRAYMAEKGNASVSLAISRGNETLIERAWGYADVETKRPATTATVYKIGSVSKQFTATLILKQVERGKIALTDSIGRFLTTGLRPEWRSLVIEQLLNHTAGMPRDYKREGNPEDAVSTDTAIAWAARDTMLFAPGTRHYYSNPGYLLLGALVEKLYGKPYGEVVRDEIAGPLGLRSLGWCSEPTRQAALAKGYQYKGPGNLEAAPNSHASKSLGAGGLCATASDLTAWNRALHGGRVLSPASYTAMTSPRGASKGYGFGIQFGQRPAPWDVRILYHLGGIMGFSAENAWIPAESLSVTMLYNSLGDGFPANFILEIARAISSHSSAAAAPAVGTRP